MTTVHTPGADWRDLPRGHYAVLIYDEDDDDFTGDSDVLLGAVVCQRKRGGFVGPYIVAGRGNRDRLDWLVALDDLDDRQGCIELFAHDPDHYRAEFGRWDGCCGVCGRKLTDPDSKMRGIGPECWGKLGGSGS